MQKRIVNPVVFSPGMFVAATDFYEKYSGLPKFAEQYCEKFIIHGRPSGLNMVNRAAALYADVSRFEKFHLLGHSLGGLDARMCLFKTPELQKKCLSFTTISTPHLGTPIADYFFVAPKDKKLLAFMLQNLLGLDPKGEEVIHECTFEYCEELNKKIGFPDIPKFCLPFIVDKKWKMCTMDKLTYAYLCKQGIVLSDGVVPLPSQLFGEAIGDQALGNVKVNFGSHLSETTGISYGLPFQTIWKETFRKYFEHLLKLENQ